MDHQEVNTIRGQFQAGQWPQFLQMVSISGLRGWTGQSVEFNFPIVAVVGKGPAKAPKPASDGDQAVAGAQRCGSNDSMSSARWVGSRVSTSFR